MPILPLIILGAIALSFVAGCDRVKRQLEPSDCKNAEKPDEYRHVESDSYRVFRTLWKDDIDPATPSPGFARFLGGTDPTAFAARHYIGGAWVLVRTECEGKVLVEGDKDRLKDYRAHSSTFFKSYFNGASNPDDEGVLVLIAGLAPAEAGESTVIGAMNAFNVPTEPKGQERDQRGELGQIFKAAYFYNAAVSRADPPSRFSTKHKALRLKPADAAYVRSNLAKMKGILSEVDAGVLTERQRVFYDALKDASAGLDKAMR